MLLLGGVLLSSILLKDGSPLRRAQQVDRLLDCGTAGLQPLPQRRRWRQLRYGPGPQLCKQDVGGYVDVRCPWSPRKCCLQCRELKLGAATLSAGLLGSISTKYLTAASGSAARMLVDMCPVGDTHLEGVLNDAGHSSRGGGALCVFAQLPGSCHLVQLLKGALPHLVLWVQKKCNLAASWHRAAGGCRLATRTNDWPTLTACCSLLLYGISNTDAAVPASSLLNQVCMASTSCRCYAVANLGCGPGDVQHGPGVDRGMCEARQPVQHPGAANRQQRCGGARQEAGRRRGVPGGLLVAEAYEPDACCLSTSKDGIPVTCVACCAAVQYMVASHTGLHRA